MELTADQKISILLSQRKLTNLQVAYQDIQRQIEKAQQDFSTAINQIVAELNINPAEYHLDLDKLELIKHEDK